MPAEPLDPPEPRSSFSTYLLLHNVLRILAADNCEIVVTTENAGRPAKAARDLLRAFGIEPRHGGNDDPALATSEVPKR